MIAQRVSHASVRVDGETVGAIGPGMLALVGVQREDRGDSAERLLERLLGYRIFADADGRMNLALKDTGGGLLLVPQFTLAADTRKGTRASFSSAAAPDQARRLFAHLVDCAHEVHAPVATGRFGADMAVALENVGPVSFILEA